MIWIFARPLVWCRRPDGDGITGFIDGDGYGDGNGYGYGGDGCGTPYDDQE